MRRLHAKVKREPWIVLVGNPVKGHTADESRETRMTHEMILSEETAAAINDLMFPPVRLLSRVLGRKRRILRKPVENPDRQPDKHVDFTDSSK